MLMMIWAHSTTCGGIHQATVNGRGSKEANPIMITENMARKVISKMAIRPVHDRVALAGKTMKESCGFLVANTQTVFFVIYGYMIQTPTNGPG